MFSLPRMLVACALSGAELFSGTAHAHDTYITAAIITEHNQVAPGQSTRLALTFTPKPGWHVYWINPGDAGMPPAVDWVAPAGVTFTPLEHPAPQAMGSGGIVSYVHPGEVALISTMTYAKDAGRHQALLMTANISWLACSDTRCVPESTTVTVTLPVSGAPAAPTRSSLFAYFSSTLPRPLLSTGRARLTDGFLEITLKAPGLDPRSIRLFPHQQLFDASAPQTVRQRDGMLTILVPFKGRLPKSLTGVIVAGAQSYSFVARAAS